MSITINDVTISDATIAHEAGFHEGTPTPEETARYALAIRELLVQRARTLGLVATNAPLDETAVEQAIAQLFDREVSIPEPSEEECRRFYQAHLDRFRSGDLVEAAHILFAVTPNASVDAIRGQAEAVIRQLRAAPQRFEEFARQFSNCPSGAQGGSLGQLQRGSTVPEFDAALFGGAATGILPQLVRTRYGFHIVRVARRIAGRELAFETARARVAEELRARVEAKALEQYVRVLAAEARIEGVELNAAPSLLLQ